MIAILMGSKSDLPVVEKAIEILKAFEVKYEVRVLSAHRTPEQTKEYIKIAEAEGVKVFIGAAGKSAHLPGVIASYTTRPVIGIPIKTSDLGGMDSLLSIVQMPSGIPVATVAINGSANAALLAIQMLALSDPELAQKMNQYKIEQAQKVMDDNLEIDNL